MKKIRSRAPLRIGLAGGGTDIISYSHKYGGVVLNATINKYAYASLIETNDKKILFKSSDILSEQVYDIDDRIEVNKGLILHKAAYIHFMKKFNKGKNISIQLITHCDAPIGSGLGSSSTIVVAIVKAFVEYFKLSFDDYDIAQLAYEIEREDCKLSGGKQDHYSAAFGGVNFIEFSSQRTIVNSLRIKRWILCEFESSLLLYYTGISRKSSNIIDEQTSKLSKSTSEYIDYLNAIKEESFNMKNCLLRGDFNGIINSINNGWRYKKKLSANISNEYIDDICNVAFKNGALAGKISGAGGGGYILFYVDPLKKGNLIRELEKFNGYISNCHITQDGCQSWLI